ncbi:hypothetical protein RNZ50_04245 [Paracoccaceae bacterium Fryx2]|nr:hypothetical protein [Paracoccaceae bacterium Fryx2]
MQRSDLPSGHLTDTVSPLWAFLRRSGEDGPVEVLGAVALAVAAVAWLMMSLRSARVRPDHAATYLSFGLVVAAGALAGFCRELSWGGIFGWSVDSVAQAKVLSAWVVGALVLVALVTWVKREGDKTAGLRAVFGADFRLILLALGIFAMATLAEKHLLPVPNAQLLEEVLELLAYGTLAAAALRIRAERRAV